MKIRIEGLDKTLRGIMADHVEKWVAKKSLSMPTIYGHEFIDKEYAVEIDFDPSDSVKVIGTLKKEGFVVDIV